MQETMFINPIRIRVLDREYTLRVREGDEEATRAMADYVDAKMRTFRTEHPEQSEFTSTIITALALAEEVFTIREEHDDLQATLDLIRRERLQVREEHRAMQDDYELMQAYQVELESDIKRLQHELRSLQNEHAVLQKQHQGLQIRYTTLQQQTEEVNAELEADLNALADQLDASLQGDTRVAH